MSVQVIDNSAEALAGLERAKARMLETIGLKAEGYAKRLCPVGTVESTGKKGYRGRHAAKQHYAHGGRRYRLHRQQCGVRAVNTCGLAR